MARALKLVVAALKAECAVILRPPTAARIVLAKRLRRVTHNAVQVKLVELAISCRMGLITDLFCGLA